MHLTRTENLIFRKSSYSTTAQECVEVADVTGFNAVRDTRHREHGALFFPAEEWSAFIDAAKRDSL